ncbi:MAG: hypothetical protein HZA34_03955 [Candidatus Pacebacteria bacterium]|nr:hypothetical protein [Candidatus Paceibacterota bacterium]
MRKENFMAEKTSLTSEELHKLLELFEQRNIGGGCSTFNEIKSLGLRDPIYPRVGMIKLLIAHIATIDNIKDRDSTYAKDEIERIIIEHVIPILQFLLQELSPDVEAAVISE